MDRNVAPVPLPTSYKHNKMPDARTHSNQVLAERNIEFAKPQDSQITHLPTCTQARAPHPVPFDFYPSNYIPSIRTSDSGPLAPPPPGGAAPLGTWLTREEFDKYSTIALTWAKNPWHSPSTNGDPGRYGPTQSFALYFPHSFGGSDHPLYRPRLTRKLQPGSFVGAC